MEGQLEKRARWGVVPFVIEEILARTSAAVRHPENRFRFVSRPVRKLVVVSTLDFLWNVDAKTSEAGLLVDRREARGSKTVASLFSQQIVQRGDCSVASTRLGFLI